MRRTIVVHNTYALNSIRLNLAQQGTVGCAVMTIEALAARLAGGFLQPIMAKDVLEAVPLAIAESTGELDAIAQLPGFRRAVAATLRKAWDAGLNLEQCMHTSTELHQQARFASLAAIEQRILKTLPPSMCTPQALVTTALERVAHASTLFGTIEVQGHTDLAPVWRPLLAAIAQSTTVRWMAGPRSVPSWLSATSVEVLRSEALTPVVAAESCANPRHEVLEAFRWARELITEHGVHPSQIAIAAASTEHWDDEVAAFDATSDVPIFAVQGQRAVRTLDGQMAAALAELMLAGVSRTRMMRFVDLIRRNNPRFSGITRQWTATLPKDAPLLSRESWHAAFASHEPHAEAELVFEIVDTVALGHAHAETIGSALLPTVALALWQRALLEGPSEALDATLLNLRVSETATERTSPESSVLWCPASVLASQPRAYVRLLGLTSRAWPRSAQEDPLLPNHIVPSEQLEPLPVHLADRRDFATICATTSHAIVCSRSRRNADGRINGASPLWPHDVPQTALRGTRTARHAASAADRHYSCIDDFANTPIATSAITAWRNWHLHDVTSHDGILPENHPIIALALNREQSASSLQMLLRDPIGYVWTYGFSWRVPEEIEEPLTFQANTFGVLLHAVLERAIQRDGTPLLDKAIHDIAAIWEASVPIPPPILWRYALREVRELAEAALTCDIVPLPGQRSWSEVAFGSKEKTLEHTDLPWDPTSTVYIGNTAMRITGRIDRIDLSGDGKIARVTDYKSGKTPITAETILSGGREIQRCIYANVVKSVLPEVEHVESQLLFPRATAKKKPMTYPLADTSAVLGTLIEYIQTAQRLASRGVTLPGFAENANGEFDLDDERCFALPAGAQRWYFDRKFESFSTHLAELVELWATP